MGCGCLWGDHGELMNDVGRDGRLVMCGRLCGGANRGAKFGLPIEGEWTCSVCGMTRCWPVRKTCFRCGASRQPAGQLGQSEFYAQARAQAEREIREVINRVLHPPPKGTAEAPTYRKPKKVPAPTKFLLLLTTMLVQRWTQVAFKLHWTCWLHCSRKI